MHSDLPRTVAPSTSLTPESAWMTIAPVTMGDYELLEELGRGAMGVVYRARQKSLGRLVALKMVQAGQAQPSALARFQQEARSAAALDHPGIVPLFDFGEADNQPFYTMAFIEGETLAGLLRNQGPLPPRLAAQLLVQIAEAVAYAHQRGILHRDLKPDNILVDRQGHPRITDFGLARRLEDGPNLTAAGSIMGTPSFMAPEQAQGETALTPGVDIYSLGGVLHALLIGRSPFTGNSAYEVLLKVAQERPLPLRQINPELPAELEQIVLRCLEKNPALRYQSADDLANDLRAWLDGQAVSKQAPAQAVPARPRRRARRWLAVVGVLLVAGLAAGLLGWRHLFEDVKWEVPERQDFDLKVSLGGLSPDSKGVYAVPRGQAVRFVIESPQDVHVGIWSLQEDGVLQLLPNEYEEDTLVRGGVPRIVPGNSKYRIRFTPSSQVEHFRVVATTANWKPLQGQPEGPFVAFKRGQANKALGFEAWEKQQGKLTGRGRGVKFERLTGIGEHQVKDEKREDSLVSEVVLPYRVRE
jgi:predicted Ser/Thr protein kinase